MSPRTEDQVVLRQGSRGPLVALVQAAVGAEPDGVFGPSTAARVREWQRTHGLVADGVVGPATWASIPSGALPVGATAPRRNLASGHLVPLWLAIAVDDLGVREIPGPEAHPRIVEWFSHTTFRATSDEVANCAAAVTAWLEESGTPSTKSVRARSYEHWGRALGRLKPPPYGAVAVFWRGKSPAQGLGHVGLYVGGPAFAPRILGANQNDECNVATSSSHRLIGYFWPEEYEPQLPDHWLQPLPGLVATGKDPRWT